MPPIGDFPQENIDCIPSALGTSGSYIPLPMPAPGRYLNEYGNI